MEKGPRLVPDCNTGAEVYRKRAGVKSKGCVAWSMRNIACAFVLWTGASLGFFVGGCVSEKPVVLPDIPEHAKAAPALSDFAFLTGRWVSVNPNKTVNDEIWTPPRGSSMAGLFRQVRKDGKPALHEVSLITAEPDGIYLRLRHLHAALEVPDQKSEVTVFKLVSVGNNRCEFTGTGTGEAKDVASVVYRLDGPNELVMEVTFVPGGKEKGYSLRYSRES